MANSFPRRIPRRNPRPEVPWWAMAAVGAGLIGGALYFPPLEALAIPLGLGIVAASVGYKIQGPGISG